MNCPALGSVTSVIGRIPILDLEPAVECGNRAVKAVAGSIGYDAASFGGIGKSGSDTFSFGPSISWAAFDLGRVNARIKIAHALADADLAAYESYLSTWEERR